MDREAHQLAKNVSTSPATAPTAAHNGALLLIYPHPDDETFSAAGTMAAAVSGGVAVTLVCATRGEAGMSGIAALDTPEILGAVREQELRAAAAVLGVTDVRFLGYRDSGMASSPDNDDPRALIQAPEEQVVAQLVVQVRAIRPATVLTFGPDGVYGHPDHLYLNRAATDAVRVAGDAEYRAELGEPWRVRALYWSTAPRERLQALAALPESPLQRLPSETVARLGTPRAEITTVIDVRPFRELKLRAVAAHRTQFGEGGPLASIPSEQREATLTREHFVRVRLPWDRPAAWPDDLLSALAAVSPIDPA